jgi:hypothetical protein
MFGFAVLGEYRTNEAGEGRGPACPGWKGSASPPGGGRDLVRFPVREGVLVGEDGAAVPADSEVAFGATLVKGSDHGIKLFVAIGADDGGIGPIKDKTAIEANGLGIRI